MQKNQPMTYLPCPVPSHEGEMLNMVCIGCHQSGLICSLCREEHREHMIVPLKILIHNLTNKVTQDPSDEEYGEKMQELENMKYSLLYRLRVTVEELAGQFERVEQEIIDRYNELKMQIIEQIHLGTEIDQLLHGVVAGSINERNYIDNIHKIAKYVKPKEKEFILSIDFERIVKPFGEMEAVLGKQLKDIQEYVEKNLKVKSKEDIIEEQKILAPPEQLVQNLTYRFSSTFKASNITVSANKTLATQSQTTSGRFAIIDQGIGQKNRRIKFKVTCLKNWIGLGVCLKNKITSINYQFKYESLGHGSFLLSNNGYTWSHAFAEDNIHSCLFTFKSNDVVEVTLEPTQLIFKVNEVSNVHKLKIHYKEEEWASVCFCVNLCSQGDAVEIIDS